MSAEEYPKQAGLPEAEKQVISDDFKKLKAAEVIKAEDATKAELKLSERATPSKLVQEIALPIRDYIGSYISLADAKAGVLIGISTGLLAATYLNAPKLSEIALRNWKLPEILTLLALFFLTLGIGLAVFVIWPRGLKDRGKGFFSWVNISNFETPSEYVKKLFELKEGEITQGIYELNHCLAVVCKLKYRWLKEAMKAVTIGAILSIVVLTKWVS